MDNKNELAMAGQENTSGQEAVVELDEDPFVIRLAKPYEFEHKVYSEIDLTGMDELNGADMIAISKIMQRSSSWTDTDIAPEVSVEYACYFAARASKLPVEFFMQLPPKAVLKVKNRVIRFLFGSD